LEAQVGLKKRSPRGRAWIEGGGCAFGRFAVAWQGTSISTARCCMRWRSLLRRGVVLGAALGLPLDSLHRVSGGS